MAFGFFIQSLDTTIVNTAPSSMAASLGENPLRMHMVIVSYVLTVAMALPVSGWLADKVGVRNILLIAIILLTLGSLFCIGSSTLNELVMARVLQGVGGVMMVPVGRLTVMEIVPREQYMVAMTLVTLPGQIGPLLGPVLGGILVEYASWYWIFLINIPTDIAGVIATLTLIPNYTMQTQRFDLSGLAMLAVGMAVLTLALDGSKGTGLSNITPAALIICGALAIALYLKYAHRNPRALFSLNLFRTPTFSLGLFGNSAGHIGSGMSPFMASVFSQIGLGFSSFHAGLMMILMVLGSMDMKCIVVQVINRFGYRRVLIITTLGLSLVSLLLMTTVLLGWYYALPFMLLLQGMANSARLSSMNTLMLKDLPDDLASSGNSLLLTIMQLSTSIGVTIVDLLLGMFSQQFVAIDSGSTYTVSMYTWPCTAFIIALPATVLARVPNDAQTNAAVSWYRRST